MIVMSAVCIAPRMHCASHAGGGMFARLVWLLIRMFMGVSVIHVVLVFATANSNVFGAFMQKLFSSDYLIDAGPGGIERQSASPQIGIIIPPCAAFVHERHRLGSGHIARFDPVDAESCRFDHGTDRAVEVTATADIPPGRRQPILPPKHGLVGCQAV